MDREALLLRSFKVLNNNPRKDPEALQILIMKLLQINHKLGLRCWEECLTTNIEEIKKDLEYEDPRSQKPDWWEQEDDDDDWDDKFILNKKMIEFCFTWIERIPDEEEQAASVAYAMELCEENKNFADM